jgi:hypothetical protein
MHYYCHGGCEPELVPGRVHETCGYDVLYAPEPWPKEEPHRGRRQLAV